MLTILLLFLCVIFFSTLCTSTYFYFFFFNDTATTEIYTLSLHDALPIYASRPAGPVGSRGVARAAGALPDPGESSPRGAARDRKSTRLNPVTVKSRMPSSA